MGCIPRKKDALFVHKLGSTSFVGSIVSQPIVTQDLDLVWGNGLLEEILKVLFSRSLDLAGIKLLLGQGPVTEQEADTVPTQGEHTHCM